MCCLIIYSIIVALTGLPTGYSVIIVLTGLHNGTKTMHKNILSFPLIHKTAHVQLSFDLFFDTHLQYKYTISYCKLRHLWIHSKRLIVLGKWKTPLSTVTSSSKFMFLVVHTLWQWCQKLLLDNQIVWWPASSKTKMFWNRWQAGFEVLPVCGRWN